MELTTRPSWPIYNPTPYSHRESAPNHQNQTEPVVTRNLPSPLQLHKQASKQPLSHDSSNEPP
jgi:hypothetical protein